MELLLKYIVSIFFSNATNLGQQEPRSVAKSKKDKNQLEYLTGFYFIECATKSSERPNALGLVP